MSEKVTSFIPVTIGDYSYLFFIVTWNDFVTPIRDELEKQADPFGEALGLKGSVIRSFASMKGETFRQIAQKDWPAQVNVRIQEDQDPFMLIINTDFSGFDPQQHPWSIVWFSDFWDKTDTIYRLLGSLAQKVRRDEDLFQYLGSVARKEKFKTLSKYFQLKTPEVFGISIDVKAILTDLLEVE